MFYMIFRPLEVGVRKKKERKKKKKKKKKERKKKKKKKKMDDILPPYHFSAVGYQMKHRFSYLTY